MLEQIVRVLFHITMGSYMIFLQILSLELLRLFNRGLQHILLLIQEVAEVFKQEDIQIPYLRKLNGLLMYPKVHRMLWLEFLNLMNYFQHQSLLVFLKAVHLELNHVLVLHQ
jgi:hypothetical protein